MVTAKGSWEQPHYCNNTTTATTTTSTTTATATTPTSTTTTAAATAVTAVTATTTTMHPWVARPTLAQKRVPGICYFPYSFTGSIQDNNTESCIVRVYVEPGNRFIPSFYLCGPFENRSFLDLFDMLLLVQPNHRCWHPWRCQKLFPVVDVRTFSVPNVILRTYVLYRQ